MKYTLDIKAEGDIEKFKVTIALPNSQASQQDIESISYLPEPAEIFTDGDNKYCTFVFDEMPRKITIIANMRLYSCDMYTRANNPSAEILDDPGQYLRSEKYLETSDKKLIDIAKALRRPTSRETLEAIFNYVTTEISYLKYDPADHGAAWSIAKKQGDCTEFADLFITLCRINNIPARFVEGYTTTGSNYSHDWAEVYIAGIGWVYIDPMYANVDHWTAMERLSRKYIAITKKRYDTVLNGYHYYAYQYIGNGKITIESNIEFGEI